MGDTGGVSVSYKHRETWRTMQLRLITRRTRKSVGLAPVEGLMTQVGNDLEEHKVAEPAKERVAHDAVPGTGPKSGALHDVTDKHGGDEILSTLKSIDGNLGNLLGSLRLIGLLEHLGQIWLDLLLVIKSGGEDAHGEDSVDLHIRARGVVAMTLRVSSIVHLDLLAECVRQGANGGLGR